MKPKFIIPPLIVLLAVGAWLVSRERALSAFEAQNEVLKQQLAKRSAAISPSTISPGNRLNQLPRTNTGIDWKTVIASMVGIDRDNDTDSVRERLRLQQQLKTMSVEELLAAFDEIDRLGFTGSSGVGLQREIINALGNKEPRAVLDKLAHRINDPANRVNFSLAEVFGSWVGKEPAAAMAWLNAQVKAGNFEDKSLTGKDLIRHRFEGYLLAALFHRDPAAASERIADFPIAQRGRLLGEIFAKPLEPSAQPAYIAIVRKQLSGEDQEEALVRPISQILGDGSYPRLTEYFSQVQGSEKENNAIISVTAAVRAGDPFIRKTSPEDIDSFRDWVATGKPDQVNRATGEILRRMAEQDGNDSFANAAELALRYHESTRSDDVLATFLEGSSAKENPAQARELAAKISDISRRNAILATFEPPPP